MLDDAVPLKKTQPVGGRYPKLDEGWALVHIKTTRPSTRTWDPVGFVCIIRSEPESLTVAVNSMLREAPVPEGDSVNETDRRDS
jgi:hypothetical protein